MDIKELRSKLGWSLERLARELKVSYGAVWRWENTPGRKPSPLAQEKIDKLIKKYKLGD